MLKRPASFSTPRRPVAGATSPTALLKQVSRSFYLSVAVLPAAVRPTIGLAYLFARAADTIADTRLIERRARIVHLEALGEELTLARAGRLAAIVHAAAGSQSLPAERRLLERLPAIFAAYRALAAADQARVRRLLATIIEGMTEDLRVFPGEDEGKLAALETRADLDRYTYLVAGCVGEFWTDVHVAHRPRLAHWDAPGDAGARRAIRPGAPAHERPARRPARPAHRPLLSAARGPGAPRPRAGRSARSRRRARRAAAAARAGQAPPSTTTRRGGGTPAPSRARRRGCDWPAPGRS